MMINGVICSYFFRGKAPIASMDAMEDMDLLSGSNTHLRFGNSFFFLFFSPENYTALGQKK